MLLYLLCTGMLLWIARRWALWIGAVGFCDTVAKTLIIFLSLIVFLLCSVGFLSINPYFLFIIILSLITANEYFFIKKLAIHNEKPTSSHHKKPVITKFTEFFLVGCLVFLCLAFFLLGLYLPPRSPDEVAYHIHFPLSCLQKGRVSLHLFELSPAKALDNFGIDSRAGAFPKGFETIVLWQMLFIHSFRLTEITSFWFFLAGLCGFYTLMKRLKISRIPALFGLLFVTTIPINLMQLTSIYVDLALACMSILAINYLEEALFEKKERSWLCFGLAVGWLPAIKYTGLGFSALLLATAILGLIWQKTKIRNCLFALMPSILSLLGLAGLWYFSNFYYLGNPLAPYQTKLLGKVIFPGDEGMRIDYFLVTPERYHHPWRALWNTFLEPVTDTDISSPASGLGAHFFIIGIPSLLFFPVWLFFNRSLKRVPSLLVFLLIVIIIVIQPYRWIARFIIVLSFLGGLSFAMVIQSAPGWWKVIPIVLFIPSVFFSFYLWTPYLPHRYFLPEIWYYFLRTGDLKAWYFQQHPYNYTAANAALKYASQYPGPLRCLVLPSIYPCQNAELQFQYFAYSGGGIEELDSLITKHKITLIFVDMLAPGIKESEEVKWLDSQPERFRKLWDTPLPEEFRYWTRSQQWMRIYEVIK
ncbi:MAG: hypothetical protein N2246_06975 [Candidatus Sumerlaeia bacterium]|nr:hypothetical protein [Candidatus Sumerlaeia bacterium]